MRRVNVSQRTAHRIYGGPRRYFQVFIHDDVAGYRAAAKRYAHADFSQSLGCCHPAPVRERFADGRWQDVPYRHWAGVIRLVDGHVTPEIVAHEFTHAALVIYRMDIHPDVRLGTGCHGREEHLAYITGDLIASATDALHRIGAWS